MGAREPLRHIVEQLLTPRREDQIDASLGKAGSKLTPDAVGRSRDHGPGSVAFAETHLLACE